MNSILNTIKKMLNIDSEFTVFDMDIIIHINSVLKELNQIGVGKDKFSITDDTSTWSEFIDDQDIEEVKTLVYLKVRLLFDPPSNSSVLQSIKELIKEYECRLNYKEKVDE